MDGYLYEKINNIERMLLFLVQEYEKNKKKEGKTVEKKDNVRQSN